MRLGASRLLAKGEDVVSRLRLVALAGGLGFQARVSAAFLAQVDALRAVRRPIPSRIQIVREAVEALHAAEAGKAVAR